MDMMFSASSPAMDWEELFGEEGGGMGQGVCDDFFATCLPW